MLIICLGLKRSASTLQYQICRELIKFTYDVIERSRRRAIQESALLARNANKDIEIRKR